MDRFVGVCLCAALSLALSTRTLGAQDDARVAARRAAARIDALLAEDLRTRDLEPNPIVDPASFARRAYLTIVGRTPSVAELDAYLSEAAGDAEAHERLVDRLLASPGRVSHEFNHWADVLRLKSRMTRRISGEPYEHFIKQSLADNLPFDRFVRELLVAEGPAYARGAGATGFWLRDLGMPLDHMANTMRVFAGTRMECAQCHDHPYDRWTQREFFELAAFTAGLRYTVEPNAGSRRDRAALRRMARELAAADGETARRALRRLRLEVQGGVAGGDRGSIRLPDDYQYDDAEPGQRVIAHTPFGAAADGGSGASRAAFADWLTSAENPRFTTVIVHRQFEWMFGQSLLDAFDDLQDDTRSAQTALLQFLEDLMRALRYDLREFQRALAYTEWFRRAADPAPAADGVCRGPRLRRLSAEQLWDSLLGLIVGDADATLSEPGAQAEPIYARHAELASLDGPGLRAEVERLVLRSTDRAAYRRMVAAERAADRRALQERLRAARRAGDEAAEREASEALRAMRGRTPPRHDPDLLRASELPQPAPPGHFLREFGQSDREQVEASSLEASVPQALRLLNGIVDEQILQRDSALMRALSAKASAEARIELAYRTILSRAPSAAERDEALAESAHGDDALGDLVWILVNSHEFRCLH